MEDLYFDDERFPWRRAEPDYRSTHPMPPPKRVSVSRFRSSDEGAESRRPIPGGQQSRPNCYPFGDRDDLANALQACA
jgi:hypothetical protein